jgi:cytochrome b561
MTSPKGYSGTQILLHWVIGLLIVFQLIFGEDMGQAWRSVESGGIPTMGLMVWAHIVVGGAVLALVVWRLALRLRRGVPDAPAGDSKPVQLAAHIGHWALYALMVLFPVTGFAAWYGGIHDLAEVHEMMKPILILLILVHLLAALWHQFWLKDNLLARMKRPQD